MKNFAGQGLSTGCIPSIYTDPVTQNKGADMLEELIKTVNRSSSSSPSAIKCTLSETNRIYEKQSDYKQIPPSIMSKSSEIFIDSSNNKSNIDDLKHVSCNTSLVSKSLKHILLPSEGNIPKSNVFLKTFSKLDFFNNSTPISLLNSSKNENYQIAQTSKNASPIISANEQKNITLSQLLSRQMMNRTSSSIDNKSVNDTTHSIESHNTKHSTNEEEENVLPMNLSLRKFDSDASPQSCQKSTHNFYLPNSVKSEVRNCKSPKLNSNQAFQPVNRTNPLSSNYEKIICPDRYSIWDQERSLNNMNLLELARVSSTQTQNLSQSNCVPVTTSDDKAMYNAIVHETSNNKKNQISADNSADLMNSYRPADFFPKSKNISEFSNEGIKSNHSLLKNNATSERLQDIKVSNNCDKSYDNLVKDLISYSYSTSEIIKCNLSKPYNVINSSLGNSNKTIPCISDKLVVPAVISDSKSDTFSQNASKMLLDQVIESMYSQESKSKFKTNLDNIDLKDCQTKTLNNSTSHDALMKNNTAMTFGQINETIISKAVKEYDSNKAISEISAIDKYSLLNNKSNHISDYSRLFKNSIITNKSDIASNLPSSHINHTPSALKIPVEVDSLQITSSQHVSVNRNDKLASPNNSSLDSSIGSPVPNQNLLMCKYDSNDLFTEEKLSPESRVECSHIPSSSTKKGLNTSDHECSPVLNSRLPSASIKNMLSSVEKPLPVLSSNQKRFLLQDDCMNYTLSNNDSILNDAKRMLFQSTDNLRDVLNVPENISNSCDSCETLNSDAVLELSNQDYCNDDDSSIVRKSKRPNKGRRYQELVDQGYLQSVREKPILKRSSFYENSEDTEDTAIYDKSIKSSIGDRPHKNVFINVVELRQHLKFINPNTPFTGSRKRKARNIAITRLLPYNDT